MKKTTILKTILMAAAMMAGSQAWAGDVTTLYSKAAVANWAATDIDGSSEGTWTGDLSNASVDATSTGLKVSVGSKGGLKEITKSLSPSSNVILTVNAVLYDPTETTQSTSNYCYFQVGNCLKFEYNFRSSHIKVYVNDVEKHTIVSLTRGDDWSVSATINTVENKITALLVAGTNVLEALSVTDISIDGLSTFDQLALGTSSTNYDNAFCLKTVTIQQETQDVTTYGYTVNYIDDGGNTVKSVSGSLAEGAAIPILTALDGEGTYAGTRYLIDQDVPSWTISTTEAENVHNVDVRARYITSLTVTRYFDGVAEATPFINAQALVESDTKDNSWKYVFPYYVQNDTKWYRATLKGAGNDKFGDTGTFTTEAINERIDYTLDEDVVLYSEQGSGTDINYSNGGINTYWKSQSIGSLDAGIYEMTAMQQSGYACTLYNGWVNDENKGTALITFSNSNRTAMFTLTESTTSLQLHNGSNARMDYILIKRVSHQTITAVDDLGYTFSSTLPLDFTGTGVEAYTAAYNSTTQKVELTRVYKVPANTGLFIKGTADDIPVLTGDADVIGTNNLVAVSAETTVAATDGDNTNYVLALADKNDESQGVVFLKAADTTVGAGKAYLQIPTASAPAPQLMLSFGDVIATGINMVQGDGFKVNGYYDLQGRKVMNPKKGLYIVNGKKVVIK